jgi:hypothetical protein
MTAAMESQVARATPAKAPNSANRSPTHSPELAELAALAGVCVQNPESPPSKEAGMSRLGADDVREVPT